MTKRLALVATLALAAFALAEEWKAPEDGVVRAEHVKDFLAYVAVLPKFGVTWHGQTNYLSSDAELRAVQEASVDKVEIQWAKPRLVLIARSLVLASAPVDAWDKAEKHAHEKLAAAKKKIDELMKNGPKELGDLDEANAALALEEKLMGEALVAMIIDRIKLKTLELERDKKKEEGDRKKLTDQIQELEKKIAHHEEAALAHTHQAETQRRAQLDLADKLKRVGATDGLKQLEIAKDARDDLDEIAQAKKDKAAGTKLDPALEPSVPAVKAQLAEIQKALAGLGSPVFGATVKK